MGIYPDGEHTVKVAVINFTNEELMIAHTRRYAHLRYRPGRAFVCQPEEVKRRICKSW